MANELQTLSSPILQQSIEAVAIKLKDVCGIKNIEVLGITGEQFTREYARINGVDKYSAYWYIKPESIADDQQSYNPFALSRIGWNTKIINDSIYKFKMRPVVFNLACSFFTQSTKELLNCIENIKLNQREVSFKLKSTNGFDVDIKVDLKGDLDFPEKDLEKGNGYVLKTTLTLHTYAGQIFRYVPISKVQVNVKLAESKIEEPINFEEYKPEIFVLEEIKE